VPSVAAFAAIRRRTEGTVAAGRHGHKYEGFYRALVEAEPGRETDRRLMARHVAGDPDAFAELVRRHRDRLWAVAVRTLIDPEDAADALQEALISAYRRAGSYRGDAAVTTWLHRIVVNACLDLVRRRTARPTVSLRPDAAERADPASVDPMAARELRLDVTAALAALPIDQRTAIVLVDIESFPVEEAAAILGVPTGTVKSRCARGRVRLATLLPAYGNRAGPSAVRPEPTRYDDERREETL